MDCTLPYLLVGMILLSAGCSNGLPRVTEEKKGGATSPVQLHRDTRSTEDTSGIPTCPTLELLRGHDGRDGSPGRDTFVCMHDIGIKDESIYSTNCM
jgi:hypothetical protein